jgi:hypothetical protein
MHNKKATVGETTTWLVATIIIILVLAIAIFISTAYIGKGKNLRSENYKDFLSATSVFSYLLTEDGAGINYYSKLASKTGFDEITGSFAIDIFEGIHKFQDERYKNVWFGFVDKAKIPGDHIGNEYFGAGVFSTEPLIIGGNTQRMFAKTGIERVQITKQLSLEGVFYEDKE